MIKTGDIARATGGLLIGPDVPVKGVSIDTRSLKAGEVFFALRGPNFDGHDFLAQAAAKKAPAVVVERNGGLPQDMPAVIVKDTLRALGDLASWLRRYFSVPLVAVSGSTGKTTTKEMIAAILSLSRPVLKTSGNRNNLIGLPLTLCALGRGQKAAVVELGINRPGEMTRLVEISDPDVALVTNMGRAHLDGLGDIKGVAREKGKLLSVPRKDSIRVVNLDDELATEAASGDMHSAVTFGTRSGADVRVVEASADACGIEALLDVRGERLPLRLNMTGAFNVLNAAAAVAAVLPLDIYLDEIREGLEGLTPLRGRLEVIRSGGLTILDDTYNANPESTSAALRALSAMPGRRVALVGDMYELGRHAPEAHMEMGALAAALGIDILAAVGCWARQIVEGAVKAGFPASRAFAFEEKEGALSALMDTILKEGDFVLVKGSRAAGLETVVCGLAAFGAGRVCCQ